MGLSECVVHSAEAYIQTFQFFVDSAEDQEVSELLAEALQYLKKHSVRIEQYSGFLTHSDFVPHNFRISGSDMYLLDHSSLRFGNKYESWARFINFMVLHNPPLARALVEYVLANRTPEESEALKLMRVFKLGEILLYYGATLSKSSGNLLALNKARMSLWKSVLVSLLNHSEIRDAEIEEYRQLRDSLRSAEENRRQENLL